MDHFYEKLPGWFDFEDLYLEMVRRAPDGARFLEIGTHFGKSLAFLAVEVRNSGKNIQIDCVDPWSNPRGVYEDLTKWLWDFRDIVTPYRGLSEELSKLLPYWPRYDFVFVDGDHNFPFVNGDIRHFRLRMKSAGIMAGHDLTSEFPGVRKAVEAQFGPEGGGWCACSKRCWRTKPGIFG